MFVSFARLQVYFVIALLLVVVVYPVYLVGMSPSLMRLICAVLGVIFMLS